jgi:ABC-2 type transport system ATP-binding protein
MFSKHYILYFCNRNKSSIVFYEYSCFCVTQSYMSITVNNLSKIYGAQKAVNNISFTINKGEIVGFLGPNGAGKSTTMKMITGYLKADGGNAVVCGITVEENSNETKKKIGYLPEANPLYYDMFVREYLEFVSNVHEVNNKKEKIEEVIKTVGLSIEANKKIGQLSKGYKQRVGLAAALIHNPDVLILDEPTSGLDPNQIVEIREVIKELGKNKTVLFSAHIMQEVEAICDRVIIINKGNIVADEQLSTLQKNTTNNHVVLVQFKEAISVEALKKLKEVSEVDQLEAGNWKLKTNDPENVRKQLMELSLQNNWNIVSLQSESNSLEEVFRNLTAK